ncbi:hypothetical protein PFMALIP_05679, partial [Plasmodium falciparum MaliPS096_E11]
MAPQNGGGGGGTQDDDAKNMFDRIGKDVYDLVKKDANVFRDELKGKLLEAKGMRETASSLDPCRLVEEYRSKANGGGASGERYPCRKEDVNRFSDKQGAECTKSKIKDSESDSVGACAPFRRLHVCDKNMEKIATSTTSDTLLAEVCMAAKYEGDSIKTHYPQYQQKYGITGSTMCTMLARSFADIGDIVRGRDLYHGKKKRGQTETERDKIEKNLQKIFGDIYEGLTTTRGKQNGELQKRYKDDAKKNFYQLREDWWTANRHTVWKALTCKADDSNRYFRQTCDDNGTFSHANYKCRCKKNDGKNETDQVPTYFDYVPQFLRWFEEWAEDFCRKKKKKVENLEKSCRGQDKEGKDRYCSRNGFDCEKTIRKIELLRMGKGCTDCFFACNPYVEWIEKQKEQFDKQKKKYDEEITRGGSTSRSGSGRQRRGARNENYDGYEKKFYAKLKEGNYGKVDAFLGLLNNEKACKDITDGGRINFKEVNSGKHSSGGASASSDTSGTNDINNGTFYRSEYCQVCPDCGVEREGKKWKNKSDNKQCRIKLYKPINDEQGTKIEILKSGEGQDDIEEKLNKFCTKTQSGTGSGSSGGGNSEKKELYDEWKCYQFDQLTNDGQEGVDDYYYNKEVETGGGLCILKKEKKIGKMNADEPDEIQKTFNPFFYYWVAHMLKDSIHWKKKLEKCLKNGTKIICKKGCHGKCDCFERWVAQKEKEWKPIKEHFKTQKGFGEDVGQKLPHYMILDGVLKLEFANENTEVDKENNVSAREIHLINEMLKEDETTASIGDVAENEENTPIDKLLKHEKKIAKTCLETHTKDDCPQPSTPESRARSENQEPPPAAPSGSGGGRESDEHSEEEEDDDESGSEEVGADETEVVEETVAEVTEVTEVKPCEIVQKLFTNGDLQNTFKDACEQKYSEPNRYWGWKCIPSGDKTATGGLCIPPRRRRLYIHKVGNGGEDITTTESLRDWFVKSAAVETFFLWHRYKEEKKQPATQDGEGFTSSLLRQDVSQEDDPQKQLQSGTIPPDFLRLMFYTLGDYRDILFSGSKDEKSGDTDIFSGDKEIAQREKTIKDAIQTFFQQTGDSQTPSVQQPSGENPRKTWWKENGEHIWKAMICALTYKESGEKNTDGTNKIEQNSGLKEAFFGENNKVNPGTTGTSNGTQNGTYENNYHYSKVELKEENSGTDGPRGQDNSPSASSGDNTPTLDSFIKRPPYFRYLEEWGQNFCKERKKRLEKIKEGCKVGENDDRGGNKKCSGYGEHCEHQLKDDPTIVRDFFCPDCGKYCGLYKKWIKKKRTEFEKQSNVYEEQKKKCKKETESTKNNDGNGFCETLEATYTDAAKYLERLKNGPCKKDNDSEEDNKGKGYIDFENEGEAFGHKKYCDPCSQFKIDCKNGKCKNGGGGTNDMCNGTTFITSKNFDTMAQNVKEFVMRVSDNNPNGFDGGLETCKDAHIFKGFRKEEWKCGKVCGYIVCKPKNANGKTGNGIENQNKIITIRALVTHWVHNFLEDYNKIKYKISHCNKKGEEPKCIKECVEKWIKEKEKEWKTLKDRFNEQYNVNGSHDYNVRSVLETFLVQIGAAKNKESVIKLSKFEDSKGCCADASAQKNDGHKDAIDCMLKKLEDKAKTCADQDSGKNTAQCQESYPEPDDEPLEETEENTVGKQQPSFCPPQKPEPVDEGHCKTDAPQPDIKEEEEEKEEEKEEADEKVPPPPAPDTRPVPSPLPPPADQPFDPTILQTTIPFGIALALGSIAFLFLK